MMGTGLLIGGIIICVYVSYLKGEIDEIKKTLAEFISAQHMFDEAQAKSNKMQSELNTKVLDILQQLTYGRREEAEKREEEA